MTRFVSLLTIAAVLGGCSGHADGFTPDGFLDVRGHMSDLHFRLTDDHGQVVTEQSVRGRTTLVYFGYTGCGSECPVTLARLAALARRISPAPRILFVSVTPDTDRPAVLNAYLRRFAAPITGLTGNSAESLARGLRAAWPQPGGPMHSDLVYIFDGRGRARFLVAPQTGDSAVIQALRHG